MSLFANLILFLPFISTKFHFLHFLWLISLFSQKTEPKLSGGKKRKTLLTSLSCCNLSFVERTGQHQKPQHGWLWLNLYLLLRWLYLLSVLFLRLNPSGTPATVSLPGLFYPTRNPPPTLLACCLWTSEIPLPNWRSCALHWFKLSGSIWKHEMPLIHFPDSD